MKTLSIILSFVFSFNNTSPVQTVKEDEIIGEWLSQKQDSKILIYKEGKKFYGKIIWGKGEQTKDDKNPKPALRNRELIGLVILKDFVFDDDIWTNGTIYDPREGKTYSCKMTLKKNNQLNIRGYVGISLFGRTEIWTRVK